MPWGYVLVCFQHYKHHQRYQHTRLANMQICALGDPVAVVAVAVH